MTKFFRVFMVVLSLVGLLSINAGAAVIADSGSSFDQFDFTFNSNLSNFSDLPWYPVTFPDGYIGLAASVPISVNTPASVVFDLPVRFPSPVSSFSIVSDSAFRHFYLSSDGSWVIGATTSVSPTISILDSSGVVLGSTSASFSVPSDSCLVRVAFSASVPSSSAPRGVGFQFSMSFSDLVFSDVSFIDYVMHVPSVVLGVVGQVTTAIVNQPFLLMTSGILLLGAGCGILGRVLSRD